MAMFVCPVATSLKTSRSRLVPEAQREELQLRSWSSETGFKIGHLALLRVCDCDAILRQFGQFPVRDNP
jgi:hypothetical protein